MHRRRLAISHRTVTRRVPDLPSWFGPRASSDDPAVAALLDPAATFVLRVHRPWATRGRVAGLRRLRERLQRAGTKVAQPVPILGRDLARVGGRWAELEEPPRTPRRLRQVRSRTRDAYDRSSRQ